MTCIFQYSWIASKLSKRNINFILYCYILIYHEIYIILALKYHKFAQELENRNMVYSLGQRLYHCTPKCRRYATSLWWPKWSTYYLTNIFIKKKDQKLQRICLVAHIAKTIQAISFKIANKYKKLHIKRKIST